MSLPAALNKEKSSPFQSLIQKKTPGVGAAGADGGGSKKSGHSTLSMSQQLRMDLEDKSRKHVQTLERKTSNMKQMFNKRKGEEII